MAQTFDFKGFKVYDAVAIKERIPSYFIGCSATILKIIEKKNIPQDQYFFASYGKKDGWKEASSDYPRRKLLIKAMWVESNVPGFMKDKHFEIPKSKYDEAPPLLELHNDEKFKDVAGNPIEIEVRGERECDKIWFRATHIGKMLELKTIKTTLLEKTGSFIEGIEYKTFTISRKKTLDPQLVNTSTIPSMFLSYAGLLRLLYVRRHPIANHFTKWATEKLFILQHGTKDQKTELAADVLGVTTKMLKTVLNTNTNTLPAVYLFSLGHVKDLREYFDIPSNFLDTDQVYKYGLTTDLKKRAEQHEANFGKIPGVQLTLKYHVHIDPVYLREAENYIKDYFKNADWKLDHPKQNELVCVSNHMVNFHVHREYTQLGKDFAGKLSDIQKEVEDLKVKLNHANELLTEKKLLIEEQKNLVEEKDKRIRDKEQMIEILLKK